MLRATAEPLRIDSAAVFVAGSEPGVLEIAASIGLGDPTALAAAVRNPAHPIARSAADRTTSFDATPIAPGGPALRSHLPLIVKRRGSHRLVGVLAVAHDRPTTTEARSILEAAADLMAVAVELAGPSA
jgi:GAF domain-containing protein